ncbi:hypothetical protein ACU8V7_22965 [Zobellia nedashkovskayae]
MKHQKWKFIFKNHFLIALSFSFFQTQANQSKSNTEENGTVVVEAEDFYEQTYSDKRKWYVIDADYGAKMKSLNQNLQLKAANGEKYIEILPDTRTNHDDKLIAGENFSNEARKNGDFTL